MVTAEEHLKRSKHAVSLSQIAEYDDLLTDVLVDKVREFVDRFSLASC